MYMTISRILPFCFVVFSFRWRYRHRLSVLQYSLPSYIETSASRLKEKDFHFHFHFNLDLDLDLDVPILVQRWELLYSIRSAVTLLGEIVFRHGSCQSVSGILGPFRDS